MKTHSLKIEKSFLTSVRANKIMKFKNALMLLFILMWGCMDANTNGLLVDSKSVRDLIPEPLIFVTPEMPEISQKEISRYRKKLLDQFIAEKKQQRKDQNELFIEFVKNQKTFYKDWSAREKEARRKFFSDHDGGRERREFVKDFIKRREELVQDQKKAILNLKKHQEDEIRNLETKSAIRKKEAEAYFKQKRKPPFLE